MEEEIVTKAEAFDKAVRQVIRNVREGIRNRTDLRTCGCPVCLEALKQLNRR